MTPQEKAKEIFDLYFKLKFQYFTSIRNSKIVSMPKYAAKQCAEYAVDEIIKSEPNNPMFSDKYNTHTKSYESITAIEYWKEVKQEIEKL